MVGSLDIGSVMMYGHTCHVEYVECESSGREAYKSEVVAERVFLYKYKPVGVGTYVVNA